jgi:hypothetical protein
MEWAYGKYGRVEDENVKDRQNVGERGIDGECY